MVLIEDLKSQILKNHIPPLLILVYKDNTFLANHYIKQIASRTEKPVLKVENIDNLRNNDPFSNLHDTNTLVFECEILREFPSNLSGYIVCEKIDKDIDISADNIICELPVLERWQLKDYLYSKCEGAELSDLDRLFDLFEKNPFQLEMEMSKLTIFSPEERKYALPIFLQDDIFGNTSSDNIFTLTNALCIKDVKTVANVLKQIDQIDVEPLGLLTLMVNNFRNMLLIQGSPSVTAEKIGMSSKQFYATSRNLGHFTLAQLTHILDALLQIDMKLKTGELPVEWIISYIINLILSET